MTDKRMLALLAARIGVRLARRPPPLPAAIPPLERTGARLGHAALYALPAAVIAVGWFEVDAGGHGVAWFGVAMPKVFPTLETLAGYAVEDTAATVHRWLAYAMLGVAAVHVAAVARHRWIDRHDVLRRMTFGGPGATPRCSAPATAGSGRTDASSPGGEPACAGGRRRTAYPAPGAGMR